MEIYFSNPAYLWLLAPIPIFFAVMFLFLLMGKKDIEQFISFRALEFLFKKGDFVSKYIKKNFLVFIFRVVVYTVVVFGIAGVALYYNGIAKEQAIVIAIDASGSMLAEDINPNRLEAVKETVNVFLEGTSAKSKIAILSFSGNSYIEQELSNKEELTEVREKIEISPISGTSIGKALETSVGILNKEKKPKLIVLISDGSENVMDEESLNEIIDTLNKEHITVDVIGIGKPEGGTLPGIELKSVLNEPLLENIAKKTNGIYHRAETKESLKEAYGDIANTKLKIPVRLTLPLIVICVLLLLVDYVFIRLA